jgi:hypothetical protein
LKAKKDAFSKIHDESNKKEISLLEFNENTTQSKTIQNTPSLLSFEQQTVTTNNQTSTNLMGNENLWDSSNDTKQSGFSFLKHKTSHNTNLMNMNNNTITQQQPTDKFSELTSNIFKVYSGVETIPQKQPVESNQKEINHINFNQPQINIQNTYMGNHQQYGYMNQYNYGYNMPRQQTFNSMQQSFMNQNELYNKPDTNNFNIYSNRGTSSNTFNQDLDLGNQKKKNDPFQNLYTFK